MNSGLEEERGDGMMKNRKSDRSVSGPLILGESHPIVTCYGNRGLFPLSKILQSLTVLIIVVVAISILTQVWGIESERESGFYL